MEMTPGQMQTKPGEASQNTTQTTTDDAVRRNHREGRCDGDEADFKKGATVYNSTGAIVGTVESSATSSAATISDRQHSRQRFGCRASARATRVSCSA